MPIIKNRSNHVKVFRPNGTQYTSGQGATVQEAIASAYGAFFLEFGRMPHGIEVTTIEVLGVTAGWSATVLEVIDRS